MKFLQLNFNVNTKNWDEFKDKAEEVIYRGTDKNGNEGNHILLYQF